VVASKNFPNEIKMFQHEHAGKNGAAHQQHGFDDLNQRRREHAAKTTYTNISTPTPVTAHSSRQEAAASERAPAPTICATLERGNQKA
jgi:hypothetical protein